MGHPLHSLEKLLEGLACRRIPGILRFAQNDETRGFLLDILCCARMVSGHGGSRALIRAAFGRYGPYFAARSMGHPAGLPLHKQGPVPTVAAQGWGTPAPRVGHWYTGDIVIELLPSILASDFARLADEVHAAEAGGGTVIHVDVMDGHFVPNLTLGPPLVKSLRKHTKLPFDVHMMVEHPDDFVAAFADAGANWMSVHYEACPHLHRSLSLIREHGMEPGVVINPATPVEVILPVLPMVHHVLVMSVNPGFGGQKFIPFSLDKIGRLKELRQELGLTFRIEVDGGVDEETIASVVTAGADLLVAGSAVFGGGRAEQQARLLLGLARKAAAAA